jgi:IS5 family transposase
VDKISEYWHRVERSLFPYLEECLPGMTEQHRMAIRILEFVRIEEHVRPGWMQRLGRKQLDRKALARAFVVKACLNLSETNDLIERLRVDKTLRKICGWETIGQIPSESTFSRAFKEFAAAALVDTVHEALIKEYASEKIVFQVSRDSTAIPAREKPIRALKLAKPKRGRGRPKKGEVVESSRKTRLKPQITQTAEQSIAELPKVCDRGAKKGSKGNIEYWTGYKFHVDVAEGGIPISAVTTSASVHDSQVAIPLEKLSSSRVRYFYCLMDTGYDADLIHEACRQEDHVPIIALRPQRKKKLEPDRARRLKERYEVEQFNSHLKDNHIGGEVRVRGHSKVHAHLMFGLLVVFAESVLGLFS